MSVFRRNLIAASVVLTSLALPLSATAASTITYTYDVFGQLVAVSSTAGRSVSYSYDAAGNRANMAATGTTAMNDAPSVQLASKSQDATALALKDGGSVRSTSASNVRALR